MGRIERVPIERPRDRPARHSCADHIGRVRSLFRVNGDDVIYWRIGRYHDGFGCDGMAVARFDIGFCPAFHLAYMGCREYSSAVALDRASQPGEVFERMKLRLPWEAQAHPCVEISNRGTLN